MTPEDESTRILDVLRPFAADWSGTLQRGDVVVSKDDLPKLVDQLATVAREIGAGSEASDTDVFHVLRQASRSSSLQDQVGILRREFRITRRR